MTPTKVPYLCGGILFSLILQARKTRTKARDKFNSGSDGLKDTDVMMGLVNVVTGDTFDSAQGSTFSKCTTQFKTCMDYGTTYIPFTDPSVISSYTSSIKQKDPDLLHRMSEFVSRFINEVRSEWLVKALIEVIQTDAEIDKNTSFFITLRETTTKENLNNVTEVELPVFLLSVLHFIIAERPDNKKGRTTFEEWHTQSGKQSQWKFTSLVGTTDERTIIVRTSVEVSVSANSTPIDNVTEILESEISPKPPKEKLEDKIFASGKAVADSLKKAIETLDDGTGRDSTNQSATSRLSPLPEENAKSENTTIIHQQTNVVQNGNNNISLTNNGTLNIKM